MKNTYFKLLTLLLALCITTFGAWAQAVVVFGPQNFGTGTTEPAGWTASGPIRRMYNRFLLAQVPAVGSNATVSLGGLITHFFQTQLLISKSGRWWESFWC
ncbi:MAG: hypothetical protein IPH78_00335 [Bacteroidetes bacterium]|nr:hypothetical protein [Bacteroidota bacterium]